MARVSRDSIVLMALRRSFYGLGSVGFDHFWVIRAASQGQLDGSYCVIYLLKAFGRWMYLGFSVFNAMQAISVKSSGSVCKTAVRAARSSINSRTTDSR
jgi:hypothetical protein